MAIFQENSKCLDEKCEVSSRSGEACARKTRVDFLYCLFETKFHLFKVYDKGCVSGGMRKGEGFVSIFVHFFTVPNIDLLYSKCSINTW